MKPQRKLELHRERLTDLAAADLLQVQGGTHIATDCNCLTHGYSCDACRVPTLPVNDCTRIIDFEIVLTDTCR